MDSAEALSGFTIERVLSSDEKTKCISVLGRLVHDGFGTRTECRYRMKGALVVMHMQV